MNSAFAHSLDKLGRNEDLTRDEARTSFDAIFAGDVDSKSIGAFLSGLRDKIETLDELIGAVQSMRGKALTITAPPGTIDIVGTGGGGATRDAPNISTAVALVVAGCGVPVAKHGNRTAASRSGSSDVLSALGINLDADFKALEKCLAEVHCCFMHAPRHHPAMKYVVEVRRSIGGRTIFNLLGPLTNPANVKRHMIGVYDLEWLGPMAEALKTLGSEAAWLAHGHDGMDEITTTASTDVVELSRGMLKHFTLEPEHVGLPRVKPEDLKGGDATENAASIRAFLKGAKSPYRDIVLFNAGAALIVAGKVKDLREGLNMAGKSVDNGAALHVLARLIELTA